MRPACGLGYLLARLSDTVADAPDAPIALRREWLGALRHAFLTGAPITGLDVALLPSLTDPGERVLVSRTADCLDAFHSVKGPIREALREVLDAITRGQLLDLDHVGPLPSEDALIVYADAVAGSVGRFWTRIAHLADPQFAAAPLDAMLAWGTRYGWALQWINIVRDLHEDLPRGRSYLPSDPATWIDRAEAGLRDGMRYTANLRNRRLQLATVLPALIGAATLRCLRESNGRFLHEKVKVTRSEAGAIVRGAAWRILLKRPLGPYFETLLQPKSSNAAGTGASNDKGTPVTG